MVSNIARNCEKNITNLTMMSNIVRNSGKNVETSKFTILMPSTAQKNYL